MDPDRTTSLACPVCGANATAHVHWQDEGGTPHAEIRSYDCPTGCRVDDETVRQLIGAQ